MGAINTTINLNDGLTSVVRNMYTSINMLCSSLRDVDLISASSSEAIIQSMSRAVAGIGSLENSLTQAEQTAQRTRQALNWQDISTPQVFMGEGLERAEQELTALQFSASRVIQEQNKITETALGMSVLPKNVRFEVENLNTRMGNIANTISRIEQEKSRLSRFDTNGINKYNSQIESLRNQMYQAETTQNALNQAMQAGDLSRINAEFSRLNNVIDSTERNIRDNVTAQEDFNKAINKGEKNANGLLDAYAAIELAQKGLSLAKGFVKNTFGEGFELNKIQSQFQARLGSEESGTALFDKVERQAQKSAFGVSELAKNTASFLSVVNKESQLDGLNSIAEKLALFDTTGQGLEGAGFSVKEALSGDIVSLAERFNMSKSLIRAMKIDELGKNGDIDGFITQFEKLLEAQKMGDSAYEQMLKDPKVQLDMFISNMKTGFATASQSALTSLTPLITRLNDWFSSNNATQLFQTLENGFEAVVNAGLGVWDILSGIGNVITENWGTIEPIATVVAGSIGAMAIAMGVYNGAMALATVAQNIYNASLWACPLTWIVIAIGAVIGAIYAVVSAFNIMSGSSISATAIIIGSLSSVGALIFNLFLAVQEIVKGVLEFLYNGWVSFGNFFSNVFKDPIGSVIRLFGDFGDRVLGIIEKIAKAIDDVFGSNLSGAVSGLRGTLLEGSELLANTLGNGEYEEKIKKLNIDEMLDNVGLKLDRINYGDAFDWGAGIGEKIDSFFSGNDDKLKNITEISNMNNYLSGNDISNIGEVENVKNVKGTVDVTSEDLKYLRDIAEQESINQFTTKMVVPDVKITFTGDIRETADVEVLSEAVKENIINELTAGAEGVHV